MGHGPGWYAGEDGWWALLSLSGFWLWVMGNGLKNGLDGVGVFTFVSLRSLVSVSLVLWFL